MRALAYVEPREHVKNASKRKLYDTIWDMVSKQKPSMPNFEWTISDAEGPRSWEQHRQSR